jgi:acetyltransferase
MFRDTLDIVLEDESVDMVLVVFGDPIQDSYRIVEAQIAKARKLGIPFVVNYLGGADIQLEEIDLFQRNGVPVFPTPSRAIRVLGYLYSYGVNVLRIKEGV